MGEEASEQQLVRESMDEDDTVEQLETLIEAVEEKPSEEPYPWPVIQYDVPPYLTYHFFNQFRTPSNPNNFLKGVKWSPDGSGFLTCSDDNTFCLYNLPYDESGQLADFSSSAADTDSYAASLVMSDGESVYDYCWYPYMSSSSPETCVFASTTRDHPIHLWDATTGQLRCTYRAYDAMDEITAAFSIAFNPAGTKIFAGYNKSIRIFDIHRPGRDFTQHSTLQGNKEGQSGIISSIAFSPSHSGLLATGSYSQTTAIHREDNMELLYVLHGQEGGVTHVQFSKDGNYLYTGGRKINAFGTININGRETLTYCAGTFGRLLTLFTRCTDHQKLPISGYILILNLEVSISALEDRMAQFTFIIFKRDSGYPASELHQTRLMVFHFILSCRWLPLHQVTGDLEF